MPLVLDSVTSTTPPKYIYEDDETGKMTVSNRKLNSDGTPYTPPSTNQEATANTDIAAAGAEPEEQQEAVAAGNTTTSPAPPINPKSLYGENPLASKAYEVKDPDKTIPGINTVRSKSNAWALLNYRNHASGVSKNDPKFKEWNAATIHGDEDNILNPTAKRIVEYSQNKGGVGFTYSYRDFIQAEHYGQISNDFLITLRRFSFPVGDDIVNARTYDDTGQELDISEPDLARAITWLSPKLGNDMKEILKFGTGFGWQDVESSVQTVTGASNDKRRGTLGSLIDGNPVSKAVESGANGYTAAQADAIREKGNGFDGLSATYPNHVYGPYNKIASVRARDEKGLKFENDFTLNFYYDLRGFDNTSPRVVFMDVLSNLLAMTYNNAPFWGGAVRGTGSGSTGKPFGDFSKLKSGDYSGYLKSLGSQLKSMGSNIIGDLGNAVQGLKNGKGINALGDSKILDNVIGGSLMKMMGSPSSGDIIKAFLTGDPTGQWHLTIGNPMNPMLVCGNLCLEDAKFEFEGPVGYEGFPSKLKMTVTLKPGRPRDKSEIESMFNAGRGRMYLQPEVDGKSLDDVVDMSQYGNKDRSRMSGNRYVTRSNMSNG
jgi:hypothetical protein